LDRALAPQLAALLTSLPIFSSTAALSLFKAKEVGQMSPSSRFAASWKPNVAYLDLNFCPLWKKQTTLPFLHMQASRTRFSVRASARWL